MRNDQFHRETCRYCEADLPSPRAHGFCDRHWRMAVLVWNRTDDGETLCPVCAIMGEETTLSFGADTKDEHFRNVHGFSMHDGVALIREKKRLYERQARGDEQSGLEQFS